MAFTKDPQGLQLIDPVLTNLAIAYAGGNYVYDEIVTPMNVATNSGKYPEWSLDDLLRDDVDSEVSDRAETPEIDLSYTLRPYSLTNRRLKVSLTPEEQGQAHTALRFRQTKTKHLINRMALRRERRLAAALRKTTNGGQLTLGGTVATKWDASSGVEIEKNVKAARKAVYDLTGQHVNTAVINWDVAYAMSLDPAIREIVKYTPDAGLILSKTGDALIPKNLHGLNWIIVDREKVNTAKEGAARNLQSIWGDSVRLLLKGETDAWGEPATIYSLRGNVSTFEAAAAEGGSTFALVDRWTEADPPVEYIRAWENVEEKVVAPDVGYEITDVLS